MYKIMKELSIEEKAKRYDEAIEVAKSKIKNDKDHVLYEKDIIDIFPALEESGDERIRKWLIELVEEIRKVNSTNTDFNGVCSRAIAWVEKQGEQYNNEDTDILQRFSFYSYKDEPNVLYLSNVFVNEEFRNKGIGTKILEIADKVSTYLKCNSIRLKTEKSSVAETLYRKNEYKPLKEEGNQIWLEKQSKQIQINPSEYINDMGGNGCYLKNIAQASVWSKKDEEMLKVAMESCEQCGNEYAYYWLKSFKDRVQPKQEWSKEDERIYQSIMDDTVQENQLDGKQINWLRDIKYRHFSQPKQEWKQENISDLTDFENAMMHIGGSFFGDNAGLDPNDTNAIKEQANLLLGLVPSKEWSEEDYNEIETIACHLDNIGNEGMAEMLRNIRDKYYHIIPQNAWKPSEEQMEALAEALSLAKNCGEEWTFDIRTLYEQLKKLREE